MLLLLIDLLRIDYIPTSSDYIHGVAVIPCIFFENDFCYGFNEVLI